MKALLLLFLSLAGICQGQDTPQTEPLDAGYYEQLVNRAYVDPELVRSLNSNEEKLITVEMLLDYAQECYNDTLKLIKFKGMPDDYILAHAHYNEAFTERQLKEMGYEYKFRFLDNTASEWKYYFVKEPTLKGFIEWIKNRK
jgi:hypothetical protein